MNAQTIFANILDIQCDAECPATQDAIDRLVAGERFRGRSGMLETLRSPTYTDGYFNSALLSAWTEADILRATGHTRDWWLNLQTELQKTRKRYRTSLLGEATVVELPQ